MAEQGPAHAGEWVVVRRPGVVRLADSMVKAHNASTLTRHRGDTMIALANVLATPGATAKAEATEPDGATWSITITVEDSTS